MKFASLFSGGGGADVGALMAGITPVWGLEIDPAIAAVYRRNIGTVHIGDVAQVNPSQFEPVDILHASPVCKSFSTAKRDRQELALDIEAALAIKRFLVDLRPQIFTLENVPGYLRSESWKIILSALKGYFWSVKILNAWDFGVPQSRKRLFLVACQDRLPLWPEAETSNRVGWFPVIADLLDLCPEAEVSPWYRQRLIDNGGRPLLVEHRGARSDRPIQTREPWQPVWTLRTTNYRILALLRAKTVALNSRCLARLQGFPDDYWLEVPISLASKILGNSVPPPVYAAILGAALMP